MIFFGRSNSDCKRCSFYHRSQFVSKALSLFWTGNIYLIVCWSASYSVTFEIDFIWLVIIILWLKNNIYWIDIKLNEQSEKPNEVNYSVSLVRRCCLIFYYCFLHKIPFRHRLGLFSWTTLDRNSWTCEAVLSYLMPKYFPIFLLFQKSLILFGYYYLMICD